MRAKNHLLKWMGSDRNNKILLAFQIPKTPRQVEIALEIKKLKLAPFLKKKLIMLLNPDARKGRFYIMTDFAYRLLKIPNPGCPKIDWEMFGWVASSPKQRLAILRTISIDSVKRTSEQIREKLKNLNPRLTRISTKEILNELAKCNLVETQIENRRRYYWINEKGKKIAESIYNFLVPVRQDT